MNRNLWRAQVLKWYTFIYVYTVLSNVSRYMQLTSLLQSRRNLIVIAVDNSCLYQIILLVMVFIEMLDFTNCLCGSP